MTLNRFQLNRVINSPRNLSSSARRRSAFKKINHEIKFGAASKANLKVVVRIRPENKREIETNQRSIIDIVDDHMLVFDPKPSDDCFFFHGVKQSFRDLNKKQNKQQKFVFENVFGPQSTNQEVFENTTKDLIATILNGYNCSVFAYGATGAGKTYTMLGSPDNHGIAFLTMVELYKKIEEISSEKTCEIGVSYLEVYNEMVKDLLEPGAPLNLHEAGQQVKVSGLSLHKPKDENELLEILERGNKNRSQHPTDINAESSRSHAVFQVFVRQQSSESGVSNVCIAKLSMIDLAGSERGTATGFKGVRFREGASINKSLLALGNCINALADGKGHIPYRDSKLTRLLKDSIGGNCRSVMIAAASKASGSFEDTFNTLKYANRAKTIKTTLKKNLLSVDHHVSHYVKIVENLREEILALNAKLKAQDDMKKEQTVQAAADLSTDERAMYEDTIQDLRRQLEEKDVSTVKKNENEETLLASFNAINMQVKSHQRELLHLEADERLLILKQFSHKNNLAFMKLYTFASNRMAKGISKSESVLDNCKLRLEYIKNRKDFLKTRLISCNDSAQEVMHSLQNLSPSKEYSESAKKALDLSNLEMISRDNHQSMQYLQDLLKALYADRFGTNKMAMLLLYAAKSFYLKLVSSNIEDTNCKELFTNIVKFLDSSQIEWADQKHTDESMHEEIITQYVPSVPSINIDYLTALPHMQNFSMSPAVYDGLPIQKRSIMKASSSHLTLPSANLPSDATPIREKVDTVKKSALSFISESELDAVPVLVPTNETIENLEVKEIPLLEEDMTLVDDSSVALNETFELITSPVLTKSPQEKIGFDCSYDVSEKQSESAASQSNLDGTFSISSENSNLQLPPQEVINISSTKKHVSVSSKKYMPNTKTIKNMIKTTIKSTPFKAPLPPARIMAKSKPVNNTPKENRGVSAFKKSVSVGNLAAAAAANTLRPNNFPKAPGQSLVRKTSFRTPNKENLPQMRKSASSSRLLVDQSTQKRTELSVFKSTKNQRSPEFRVPKI